MEIKSVKCLFFSPTGTTRTITQHIAEGLQADQTDMLDCTSLSQRNIEPLTFKDEIVIIASPVYYGRLPEKLIPFLKTIRGENTPVVPVVVYGNREFEDALIELYDILADQGFIPVAGGAFVGEHSYSLPSRPIAQGRPDSNDIEQARFFGADIQKKFKSVISMDGFEKLKVSGSTPYLEPENLYMLKEVRKTLPFTPETDMDKCSQCYRCVDVCPTEAVSSADVSAIDRWECLICFACIKNCPSLAKQMTDPHFNGAIEHLQQACQERKEPEIFL